MGQPEGTGQRPGAGGPLRVVRQLAQLLGDVGDRRHGVGGQPAADQDQGGRQPAALLGEGLGGPRVDGDPDLPDGPGEQPHGGARVQAADGAGADARDAGQRAPGRGDDQAVRVVRQQRIDLFRVHRVVEEQQGTASGERLADHPGELVPVGAGRAGHPQLVQQLAGGALGGHRHAAGVGEPGAEQSVGVVGGGEQSAGELSGECGASGAGASGDQQDPGAGGLATGQGVEAGVLDVGPQRLQLAVAADESGWGGTGRLLGSRCLGRAAGVHRLIRHGPRSTSLHASPAGTPVRAFRA